MSATIRAVYRRGLFEPLEAPAGLTENQVIELEVRPLPPVTRYPRIMGGRPCIAGTRMPIDWVFQFLERRDADPLILFDLLDRVLRLFRTAASLYEKKVIAHASHCTVLTEHDRREVPYPP